METGGDQAGQEGPEGETEGTGERIATAALPPRNDNGGTMDGPQGAADITSPTIPAGTTDAEEGTGETDSNVGAPPLLGMTDGRTWTLNYLGQAVTASEADMVTLAQKGLDYDRIRSEYDEARPVMDLFRDYAKRSGITVPEYLGRIREQAKQAEGMSQEEARRAVELEDREAVVAAQEAVRRQQEEAQRRELARRQAVDARMQADLREFREVFPEAAQDPASIPREVWEAVRNGRTLVGAYAAYSQRTRQEAAAREEALRAQQARNEAASAGSMRSQDGGKGPRDPFAEGFDEE